MIMTSSMENDTARIHAPLCTFLLLTAEERVAEEFCCRHPMVAMAASAYTSTPLPRMGLGMAALGRPGYINLDRSTIFGSKTERSVQDMQQQANKVMDELFTLRTKDGAVDGVWLDCARSYGMSEKFVGDYLRSHNIPKAEVYVSSKWGYSEFHSRRMSCFAFFKKKNCGDFEMNVLTLINIYHSSWFIAGLP